MSDHTHILLATLGGQPQVVTFTLDLLLGKDFPITEVIVLHPKASEERLKHSLACLRAEFVGDRYAATDRIIHLRSHVLQLDGQPIDDITDDSHADGTLDTLHHLIGDLKRQGYRIHLSVTGGRRLISLLATSVATLNFDRHDHVWHIHTPKEIREKAHEGAMMHVPPDAGVKLIQGPFVFLRAHIYNPSSSFRTAQEEQRSQLDAQEHARCEAVVKKATPRQLEVLQAFSQGLRPQQVATELRIEMSTIRSHTKALLGLYRNAWNIAANDESLDYHFLQTAFADYFAPGK